MLNMVLHWMLYGKGTVSVTSNPVKGYETSLAEDLVLHRKPCTYSCIKQKIAQMRRVFFEELTEDRKLHLCCLWPYSIHTLYDKAACTESLKRGDSNAGIWSRRKISLVIRSWHYRTTLEFRANIEFIVKLCNSEIPVQLQRRHMLIRNTHQVAELSSRRV